LKIIEEIFKIGLKVCYTEINSNLNLDLFFGGRRFMGSNTVVINDHVKFVLDDIHWEKLLLTCAYEGSLQLACGWCGLTVLPQANAAYAKNLETEQKVICVGCGRTVEVRMYPNYGFVVPSDLNSKSVGL